MEASIYQDAKGFLSKSNENQVRKQLSCGLFHLTYRKILKISSRAYIFQRPFLRGLNLEGLICGGKFAFQNRLG